MKQHCHATIAFSQVSRKGVPAEGASQFQADFRSGIATFMALDDPGSLIGLHLTSLELAPYAGTGSRPLSNREQSYRQDAARWDQTERTTPRSSRPGRKPWTMR